MQEDAQGAEEDERGGALTVQERMERIAQAGLTVSVCCGPSGSKPLAWSVQVLSRDGREFDVPFEARDLSHAVDIAEVEIAERGWL